MKDITLTIGVNRDGRPTVLVIRMTQDGPEIRHQGDPIACSDRMVGVFLHRTARDGLPVTLMIEVE